MSDDPYVTIEEAEQALGRLRLAKHLSVRRYRDIVYVLQHLLGNPGETNPEGATHPSDAAQPDTRIKAEAKNIGGPSSTDDTYDEPIPTPLTAAAVRDMVAETIKAAVDAIPSCAECKQVLPDPPLASTAEPEVEYELEPEYEAEVELDTSVGPEPEPEYEPELDSILESGVEFEAAADETEPLSLVDLEDSYSTPATAEYATATPDTFEL